MELLVAYDIETSSAAGERRLVQVAGVCERFGVRVQKSVFEFRLNDATLESLKIALFDVIDPGVDAVDIYRFDRPITEVRTSLGRPHVTRPGGAWIIGPAPRTASDP
jgi:CRISPR-associated protein Cas2